MIRLAHPLVALGLFLGSVDPAQAFGWRQRASGYSAGYYAAYYTPSYYWTPSYYYTASYYYTPSYYAAYFYTPSYYYTPVYTAAYPPVYTTRVYYQPVVAAASFCIPTSMRTVPTSYATPTPAPASTTREPPLPLPPATSPKVTESRSFPQTTQDYSTTTARKVSEQVRVSFWNLSNRDLTLRIDGVVRVLGRDRSLTLTLPREFLWAQEDREALREVVPPQHNRLDIVLRQ